jgi:hypothetical protein
VPMNQRLELELQRGLRQVTAPPELWDRLQSPASAPSRAARVSKRFYQGLLAAAVTLAMVGLSFVHSPARPDSPKLAFHCQNPAQLRAWVRANTGLDVPLRSAPPASIQLIGAQSREGRVEIAYTAGNHDALLLVSRAGAGSANEPHSRISGNVSSWVMDGQRFTLTASDAAELQLACKLCHLD